MSKEIDALVVSMSSNKEIQDFMLFIKNTGYFEEFNIIHSMGACMYFICKLNGYDSRDNYALSQHFKNHYMKQGFGHSEESAIIAEMFIEKIESDFNFFLTKYNIKKINQ